MAAPPPMLTETQAIQQLMASKGGVAATKAAAAAGLDREAIREVMAAKAAAAKGGVGVAATKAAVAGAPPVGVEPDLFRQATATKVLGAKSATAGTTIGMAGAEPDVVREAVRSKVIGGPSVKVAASGKGAALVGQAKFASESTAATKGMTTGGTLWSGKGVSFGLGLGLGIWGPVLVVACVAAASFGCWRYWQSRKADEADEESSDFTDALAPRNSQ